MASFDELLQGREIFRIDVNGGEKRRANIIGTYKGKCVICKKSAQHYILYFTQEDLLPIILIVVNWFRWKPHFYADFCTSCSTSVRINYDSVTEEARNKFGFNWLRGWNNKRSERFPVIIASFDRYGKQQMYENLDAAALNL